ncbi:WSC domain-containing protein, partial [Crucibulum laeve]
MTISSCISFCSQGNYKYAGLEFARVHCDNAIHSPGSLAALADCNMACTGDSTTFCGGADRISIFISNAVAPTSPAIKKNVGTWQYKGCYQDFGPRILVHQITLSGVTAEICTSACKSRGYGLAGLEFGDECWCDNYLPFGQLQADTDCNMPCAGDGSELCGAGNRMVLY